ncbi:MAG: IseA DL-endopeptidase inhibitor family protein [Bacillota bacterium]|nr:IseA DL-endopeptidase inhibitor family protein [Bacillota bacterium]MDP4171359.1 IseA DL-endopeptidase inhibitor family protein [Bacillota bacterium]
MKQFLGLLMAAMILFTFSGDAYAQKTKNNLTAKEAVKLAQNAQEHFWSMIGGSNNKIENPVCSSDRFKYKGMDYRYFCSEFDTKKKLFSYLNEAFTLNAITKGMKKYGFIGYKGKMAQPNADGGSIAQWDKSHAKLLYQRKDVRLFEFTVQLGDMKLYEKHNITFVNVGNKWLINDIDAAH